MPASRGEFTVALRWTTYSNTERAAPTGMLVVCPVVQTPPQNKIAVGLAGPIPSRTVLSSSSKPERFAPVPLRRPMSTEVGW